jgi:hypothetical protein
MIVFDPPASHRYTPGKVLLISGLSDPTSCALSLVQKGFLASLAVPETWKIYRNFPCLPGPEAEPRVALWRASLANLRQFLLASRRAYRQAAGKHWEALTASTEELIVITLSCGLEIVNNCLAVCPRRCQVRVLALGPVAWELPSVPHTLIQGSHDHISRVFFRTVHVLMPGVGHMDYLAHEQTTLLTNSLLSTTEKRRGTTDSTDEHG